MVDYGPTLHCDKDFVNMIVNHGQPGIFRIYIP